MDEQKPEQTQEESLVDDVQEPTDEIGAELEVEETTDAAADETQEVADEPSGDDEQPAEEGEETPADDSFDESLLKQAEEYGFSRDEAKAFRDKDSLTKAMTALDRQLSAFGRQSRQTQQAPTQTPKQEQAPTPAPTPTDVPELKIDLPDDYGPEIKDVVNNIANHFKARTERVEMALRDAYGALQQQAHVTRVNMFDSALATLNRKELYGEGPSLQLDPSSPEYKARDEVFDEMEALVAGYQSKGRPLPGIAELVRRAERNVHGAKLEKQTRDTVRKEVEQKVTKRNGQALVPSGTRLRQKEHEPETRAKLAIAKILKAHGGTDDFDAGGLPD